tara:strand:+ start:242 stop:661 length:420 start_codon:yes stop_codon:yes gene_type:complete
MKNLILIFIFSISFNIANAQTNEGDKIPSWIETILNKQFQNISIDDWQKIDTEYFVQFKYEKHETEVCLGPNNNIVYIQTILNKKEIPSVVIDAFNKGNSSEVIRKIKLNKDYKGDKTYIINTLSGKNLIFDITGKIVE